MLSHSCCPHHMMMNIGLSCWTSRMHLIPSTTRPCLWSSTNVFPVYKHGWSPVIPSNHSSHGDSIIKSCCGVQHGGPLGPLGFALMLQPLVERIKAEVPSLCLNSWYLDDGTLVGPPDSLAAALNIVESDGPAIGLHLNRGKSQLHIPADISSSIPPDIPTVGFCLLVCLICPPPHTVKRFSRTELTRVVRF